MNTAEWKKFLIRRFLFILVFVSLSEELLNIIYEQIVFPWMSETFHIDFFTAGMENGQSIDALLRGGVYLAVTGVCNQLPDVVGFALRSFSEKWAGNVLTGRISDQTMQMSPAQRNFFILGMIAITILILLTLLLPYVIAAFWFGQTVSVQIQRMEEEERQRKADYDSRRNLLLSDVAHDLKTPMTTVAGYARVLLEQDVSPSCEGENSGVGEEKRQEYLETIYNKSMQMSGLLNLLFEYVKLESEGFELNKTESDVLELIRECVAGLYMDFEEKGMEMTLLIPEEIWIRKVDRIQFQRVINNLLNNALRHNPPGTRVWVKVQSDEEELVIRICDNGAIIPQETAAYIFEPFVLGDESRNSKGGSGLGLSIARKVITMHGGVLTLEQGEWEEYTKAFVIRLTAE